MVRSRRPLFSVRVSGAPPGRCLPSCTQLTQSRWEDQDGLCSGAKPRTVRGPMPEHGPSDPRELVGQCDHGDVRMRARLKSSEPDAEAMPFSSDAPGNGMCAEHEEATEMTVASLAESNQPSF